MPWSFPDDVPSVAQNWTDLEQRVCVLAANATLAITGDDEAAIFACIRAAGKSDRDDALEDLVEQKKSQANRKRLPKTPMPRNPQALSRRYIRRIAPFSKAFRRAIREIIIPQLENLQQEVGVNSLTINEASGRADQFSGSLALLMAQFVVRWRNDFTDQNIERAAFDTAEDVQTTNNRDFTRLHVSVLGVDPLISQPYLQEEVALFTRQNVRLIRALREQEMNQVETILAQGIPAGRTNAQLAADLRKRAGITDRRARLIARDQASKFNGRLTQLRQQEAGVESYTWVTAGDERVRPTHMANDRKIFRWDDPPAETGHPGNDVNCRCVAIPVFDPAE